MKQLSTISLLILLCISINAQDKTLNFPNIEEYPTKKNSKENTWFFIMAGQSNMTGRGLVEPQDTITNKRVLSINKDNKLILAKEPLAFYSAPNFIGLDCGLSFGKELLNHVPDSISVVVIPTAVGGSSTNQWITDENHRGINLLSNIKDKTNFAQQNGILKGIIWHQGESDAHNHLIPFYKENLMFLFSEFRFFAKNEKLPIFIAELGSFFPKQDRWNKINEQIHQLAKQDKNIHLIKTADLEHKGDSVHFNSASQRLMGKRFAIKVSEN